LLKFSSHFNKRRRVVIGSKSIKIQLLKLRRYYVRVKAQERVRDNVSYARFVITIKVELLKEHASTDQAKVRSISTLSLY
jgi:hypothetical protein